MLREEEGKTSALRRTLENATSQGGEKEAPSSPKGDNNDSSIPNSPVPFSTKDPLYEAFIKTWCFVGEPAPLQADLAGEKKVLAEDVPAPGQSKPASASHPQDQPRAPRRTKSMILQTRETGESQSRSTGNPNCELGQRGQACYMRTGRARPNCHCSIISSSSAGRLPVKFERAGSFQAHSN
ncbi:hypothetical protein D9611_000962 [Ephemerocybe angulata]|uniref:Uncharacterized protein n=1 Tax=Ephemerocybe angulata TaxID=980116 RepID=A0A8H5F7E4_9AGAR|nr:hypothetical protein D9611_000962 [Tulosesus angulatus]